jgi:hypothetical protein
MLRYLRNPHAPVWKKIVWIVEDLLVLAAIGAFLMAVFSKLYGETPQWLIDRITGNEKEIEQLNINTEHRESVLETEIQELTRKVDSQGTTLLWILGFSGLLGTKSGADMVGRLAKRGKRSEDE